MARNQGKILVSTAKNGEQYFELIAENGRTLMTSETYSSQQALENGIQAVKDLLLQKNLIVEGLKL